MGGARSEVGDDTTRVLMEVATWDGPNIHRTSNALGLRSEARGRFEKGLAPEQALEAQIVATKLMLELTGATRRPAARSTSGVATEPWPDATIRLRDARVAALLGLVIPRARQKRDADRAGLRRGRRRATASTSPCPHFRRNDVTREADLDRGGRALRRLDKLPGDAAQAPRHGGRGCRPSSACAAAPWTRSSAAARYEIVGWSFTEPGVADRLRLAADDPRRSVRRRSRTR